MQLGQKLGAAGSEVSDRAYRWVAQRSRDPGADFLINRLLRRPTPHLPDSRWQAVAARALHRVRRASVAGDELAWTLAALLSRLAQLRSRTHDWLLRRYLPLSHIAAGRKTILSNAARRELAVWLGQLAVAQADPTDVPVHVCRDVEVRWNDAYAPGFGSLVGPLLPLAHRSGDGQAIEAAEALTTRWLFATNGDPAVRDGFARACLRLVEQGAWPAGYGAEHVLRRLGVIA